MRSQKIRSDRGQATVELVALIPVLTIVALAIGILLASHRAKEAADQAAVAAAVAQLQGRDPVAAARAAVPGWVRPTVTVRRGQARVRLHWRAPQVVRGLIDVDRSVTFAPSLGHAR